MNTKPYQFQIEDAQQIQRLNGRCLLASDMGVGKSLISLLWAYRHPKVRPIIIVCPASLKWNWANECLHHFGWRSEILEGTKPERRLSPTRSEITIINYDILSHWLEYLKSLRPQLMIMDECFPYKTPILTNQGWVPIGKIVEEKIPLQTASYNFKKNTIEFQPILHYFKNRKTNRTITIIHENGKLTVTENHKIWTEDQGYVKAINLSKGSILRMVQIPIQQNSQDSKILQPYMLSTMDGALKKKTKNKNTVQTMQNPNRGEKKQQKNQTILLPEMLLQQTKSTSNPNMQMVQEEIQFPKIRKNHTEVLLNVMRSPLAFEPTRIPQPIHEGMERESIITNKKTLQNKRGPKKSRKSINKNDKKQPGKKPRNSKKNKNDQRKKWDSPHMEGEAWRKRSTDTATKNSMARIEKKYGRMGNGTSHIYGKEDQKTFPIPNMLQGGHRKQKTKNSHRNRRTFAQMEPCENKRQEKRILSKISRVVSITIHERPSRQGQEINSKRNQFVYNIEVKKNNNYFANNVLVSNCHYCKSRQAIRTRTARELAKDIPHILALSGTPLTNRPAELWPILNILHPKQFPSFYKFAFAHCSPKKTRWGWDFRGASNLPQLHATLKPLMIRRLKKDVLKELPSKQRIVIPMDVSKRGEYQKAVKDFRGWMLEKNPSKGIEKAEQLVKMGYLKRLAAKLKMPFVLEWIDDFLTSSDSKLVVFGIHRKILGELVERYKDISVLVDGSIIGNFRQLAVEKFQRDKHTRIFIGNIKAAGVGINLTAANTVAFCEVDWVPGNMVQAEDRIHRLTQNEPCSIYYLVARETIESKLLELIQKKQKTINAVLEGNGKGDRLDIYDQLSKILMEEK